MVIGPFAASVSCAVAGTGCGALVACAVGQLRQVGGHHEGDSAAPGRPLECAGALVADDVEGAVHRDLEHAGRGTQKLLAGRAGGVLHILGGIGVSWTRRSPSWSRTSHPPCWTSAAAQHSPPRRSSARQPTPADSGHGTPTPATTAPRHCRSGPAAHGTGSAGSGTGSSTPPSTASPSPRRTTTPQHAHTWNADAPTATPKPNRSGLSNGGSPTSSTTPC